MIDAAESVGQFMTGRQRVDLDRDRMLLFAVVHAAKRFGVKLDVVRAWIKRGLVKGERNDFEAHRRVWWLEITEDTAARLERLAAPLRRA